jgi:hypothetical protein
MSDDTAPTYIRGGSATTIDRGRVLRWIAGVCGSCLLVLAVALGWQTAHTASQIRALRDHGVPVKATVTSCFGIASGTGITATGYLCTARFTLDGAQHSDTLTGTQLLYQPGTTVDALTDPNDLGVLRMAANVNKSHPALPQFVTPALILLAAVGLLALAVPRRRTKPDDVVRQPSAEFRSAVVDHVAP